METQPHQEIDDVSLKVALKQNMIGVPDLQDTQSLINCLEECIRRYKRLETSTKTNQPHARHEEDEDLNCSIGAFVEEDEIEIKEEQHSLLATKIAAYKSQRESLQADIQVLQGQTRKQLLSSKQLLLETDEASQQAQLERLESMSLKELVVFYQNLQSQLQEAQDKGMF